MNIATVAAETVWKNSKKNIELTEFHVKEVMRIYPKTHIILFPEISLMGFVVDDSNTEVAETMDGYCVNETMNIAKKYKVALICGMIEKNSDGKPFNTQFVVSKTGEILAKYRKNHLFTQSTEPKVFNAGDELTAFDFEGWYCGLATCFDIRFPRLFETYKNVGVECVFVGFNWVEGRNKEDLFDIFAKARAHENQYFLAAVDRSGSDPNTSYYGKTVIANPYGEDVSEKNGIYSYAEISKNDIETIRNDLPLKDSFKESYVAP